ncbi:hypothetical protein [Flaviaesturariibacter amylovorans]|uniref:Uncharacterized protein n=1 Tax=Flaviaesturariibacter amylovorans TaxID=1084520 RepID=A0ABP8GL83_9BACT
MVYVIDQNVVTQWQGMTDGANQFYARQMLDGRWVTSVATKDLFPDAFNGDEESINVSLFDFPQSRPWEDSE